MATCRNKNVHFVCHKGQVADLNIHCRDVHEISPSLAYRFAKAIGIVVREIDPDTLSPTPE